MLPLRLMPCAFGFMEEAIISLSARIRSSRLSLGCAIRFYLSSSPEYLDRLRVGNGRFAFTASSLLLVLASSIDELRLQG